MVLQTIIGFGVIFGAAEGIRSAQAKSRREEHRSRKNNLMVHVPKSSIHSPILEGRRIVLSGNKLYVDTGHDPVAPFGHPFAGYYLPYPDTRHPGLVSTITPVAPIMNWIFVDRATHEVKFGVRAASEGHLTGPWDCTRQDRRLTFMGWEGFVAVKEGDFWALYFDYDGDRLESKGITGPIVEVELWRRELKMERPVVDPEVVKALLAQQEAEKREQEEREKQADDFDEKQALKEEIRKAREAAGDTDAIVVTPEQKQRAEELEVTNKAMAKAAQKQLRKEMDELSAEAEKITREKLPSKSPSPESPSSNAVPRTPSPKGDPTKSPSLTPSLSPESSSSLSRSHRRKSRSRSKSKSKSKSKPVKTITSLSSSPSPSPPESSPDFSTSNATSVSIIPNPNPNPKLPKGARNYHHRNRHRPAASETQPTPRSKSHSRHSKSLGTISPSSSPTPAPRIDDEPMGPPVMRGYRVRQRPAPLDLSVNHGHGHERARSKGVDPAVTGSSAGDRRQEIGGGDVPVVVQPPRPLDAAVRTRLEGLRSPGSKILGKCPTPVRSPEIFSSATNKSPVSASNTSPHLIVLPPRQFLTPKTPRRRPDNLGNTSSSAPRRNTERPPAANVREMVRRFRREEDTVSSEESARPGSMSSLEWERGGGGGGKGWWRVQ